MTDFQTLADTLRSLGYTVQCFDTAAQATDYLDGQIDGRTVGMGGSVTLQGMDLYPRLASHNQVAWHWAGGTLDQAAAAQVYISSVNALAETGEVINIDGNGNRVASTIYGHEKVYLVVGVNKIAPDYDAALWRARNVAAPKNAQRLNKRTPCAVKGDRCYNCSSPERICRALSVFWCKPTSAAMEIILVAEELGF